MKAFVIYSGSLFLDKKKKLNYKFNLPFKFTIRNRGNNINHMGIYT